jgi:pimeloyl-ACP methyl ester carboxylesterase/DNA-binding CsgD family transcriptional regulator
MSSAPIGGRAHGLGEGEEARAPYALLSDVIASLYAYAADPENWEDLLRFTELVDRKEESLPKDLLAEISRHLEEAARLAEERMAQSEASGAQPPPAAFLALDGRGRLLTFNEAMAAQLRPLAGALEEGAALSWSAREDRSAFEEAFAALKDGAGARLVRLNIHAPGTLPVFGFLLDGARLPETGLPFSAALSQEAAAVFLMPARALSFDEEVLSAALLGLSPAEARLVGELTRGLALKEAARALGISPNTARNQLANVFEKFGLNRQGDLIRHVAELMVLGTHLSGAPQNPPEDDARLYVELPDGRQLAYREYGAQGGTPVLNLVPAITGSFLPRRKSEALQRSGIRLIRVERPGTGGSTFDPHMTIQSFAKDLRVFMDALGLERVLLYGSASAAPFVLAAASELGERVERAGLAAPRIDVHLEKDYRNNPALSFYGSLIRNGWLRRGALQLLRQKLSRKILSGMMQRFFQGAPADAARLKADPALAEELLDALYDSLSLQVEGVIRESELASGGYQLDPTQIRCPLHVWLGGEDTQVPLEEAREGIARFAPASLRVFEGEGHLISAAHLAEILDELVHASSKAG